MNYLKINERLSLLFLFIALTVRPLYKYCEYVLHFPRVNITVLYIILLIAFILTNIYYSDSKFRKGTFNTFWLLLMVTFIQICSFPTVVHYTNNGSYIYLLVIAQTTIQYWLFWFVGTNINRIWSNEKFWKVMSYIWLFLASVIIWNAWTNQIFAIIFEGTRIYLMLADSFAVLSVFILCKLDNRKKELLLILIASICLFAVFSRAALYCFIITSFIFLYKKNKILSLCIITSLVAFIFLNLNNSEITDNRMIRLIFGSYDLSQSVRQNQLDAGIEDLSSVWILGDFMGDIDENFGLRGNYIHNYLSFWRQFGFIPFLAFVVILLGCSFKIFKYWIANKDVNGLPLFLFCFTVFALLEIILARSFVYPYIWMSIGGINAYFNYDKDKT